MFSVVHCLICENGKNKLKWAYTNFIVGPAVCATNPVANDSEQSTFSKRHRKKETLIARLIMLPGREKKKMHPSFSLTQTLFWLPAYTSIFVAAAHAFVNIDGPSFDKNGPARLLDVEKIGSKVTTMHRRKILLLWGQDCSLLNLRFFKMRFKITNKEISTSGCRTVLFVVRSNIVSVLAVNTQHFSRATTSYCLWRPTCVFTALFSAKIWAIK
jgi:hypothetical protein